MTTRGVMNSVSVLLALVGALAAGQSAARKSTAFRSSDYPKAEFQVTQSIHSLGSKFGLCSNRTVRLRRDPDERCSYCAPAFSMNAA